jgi:hypothetical protein
MLTNQGNTQIYSPFGTYVVEQHGPTCQDVAPKRDTAANERGTKPHGRNASGQRSDQVSDQVSDQGLAEAA